MWQAFSQISGDLCEVWIREVVAIERFGVGGAKNTRGHDRACTALNYFTQTLLVTPEASDDDFSFLKLNRMRNKMQCYSRDACQNACTQASEAIWLAGSI
jgi:hypothetical protein